MSGIFVNGILGINYLGNGVNVTVASAAILTLLVSVWLGKSGYPLLRS